MPSLYPSHPILLVDDESEFIRTASFILRSVGINNIIGCSDSREVIPILSKHEVSAIALDVIMPHVSGVRLLPQITNSYPELPIIMITAVNEVESAVQCMKDGAFDYIVKPVEESRLITCIRHAIEKREMYKEADILRKSILEGKSETHEAFAQIITNNPLMLNTFQYAEAIAKTTLPILITGQTGTGKELMAEAIHVLSGRQGEFVPIDIAGLDSTMFADTLFGHTRGAYTGAEKDRKGMIEQAAGGTLFLDEICDLNMESQIKLLRLIQEHRYYPLGSDLSKSTDARIIAATNKNPAQMQEQGLFRKDLFYRLHAHEIALPTLSERKDDIPLLVEYFLQKAANAMGKSVPTPPRELFTLLNTYHFPGNVRELEGMVLDAVSRHKSGIISLESFQHKIKYKSAKGRIAEQAEFTQTRQRNWPKGEASLPSLKEAEEALISEALERANGNITLAAKMLGMSRQALSNRLHRVKR